MTWMQSLVYVDKKQIEWREAPAPTLSDDADVLVRPLAASFCDLDRAIARGHSPFVGPFALGHEAVGEVVDVGAGAALHGMEPGQRVVIPFYVSCGACDRCTAGRPLNCRRTPWLASYGNPAGGSWGGLFDDVVRVPWGATSLVPVPQELSSVLAASVGDNLTDAFVAVGPYLSDHQDASVLVLGGTPSLGLMVVMFAVELGTGPVTYVDDDPQRCATARRFGAHVIEQSLPERVEGEYDLVVEAHGNPKRAPAVAVRSVKPGGHCHFRCVYFADVTLPYLEICEKGVTIEVGLPQIQVHAPRVLDLLSGSAASVSALLNPSSDWSHAPDAVLEPTAGKPVFVRER